MRVLIVDDERLARTRLAGLLRTVPAVVTWEEAADAEQAVRAIADFRPDVLLLDIHMPGRSGVDLARALPPSVGVVFVTADPSFAIDAFEVGAFDYVLKPVQLERLVTALGRAVPQATTPAHRLLCRSRRGLRLFDAVRIPRFRAEDKYTVFMSQGEDFFVQHSLDTLGDMLPHMRVHRAELVDLACVASAGSEGLVLHDGQQATVSRRRWPAVRRALEQLAS